MPDAHDRIREHYASHSLTERIVAALQAAGLDPARLTTTDLAAVDQFHAGGLTASRDLARLAGLRPGSRVLDLGGGIGGPARLLAAEFGCEVSVLDLTPSFCEAGRFLTEATGLTDRVRFSVGNGLEPPFAPASFDVCWTQHSTMNIPDKPGLYRAARRMLRPGGLLVMHEITAGGTARPRYPTPWATDESISHLTTPAHLRRVIEDAGFRARAWNDVSEQATTWFRERLGAAPAQPAPLGPHLLVGRQTGESFRNLLENLEEDRVRVVMAVFETAADSAAAPR